MLHWLEKRTFLTPDRIALTAKDETVTFRQLRDRSRQCARSLSLLHIGKGDHVALLCHNGIHVPELIHALHYVGAVVVPLNTRLTSPELVYQLRDARCALLIYDDVFSDFTVEFAMQLPELNVVAVNELPSIIHSTESNIQTYIDPNALHTIVYTSGTTGHPKGVMLTFANHWASAIGSALNLGLSEQDHWLACVPLFHVSGISILMRSVIYGMPVTIHESFDPHAVNRAICEQGITIVSVVGTMLTRMMDQLGDESYPEHFRCMLLGGGPAPLPLLEACRDKAIPVYQTYGLTETSSQIATLSPDYALSKLGSAGKPLFQAELRIVHQGLEAEPNVAGEIFVRGPSVTKGYLSYANTSAEIDEWLATGDIGYVDGEGFLYVLDRRSDLIVSGGENVYPAEIESVLLGHPYIVEAGVTGIEDGTWGQVPIAFVKLNDNFTISEQEVLRQLLNHCTEKLAKYKIPKHIYVVESLPRNASNKLLRRELVKLLPANS